jgi:hypothetical protein
MSWWQKFIEVIKRIFFDGEVYDPSKEPQEIKTIPPGMLTVKKVKLKTLPKVGDVSNDVKLVQQAVKDRGIKITVDGAYGTKDSVPAFAKFQKSIGLPGSGVLGPKTIEALGFEVDSSQPVVPVEIPAVAKDPSWLKNARKYQGWKEDEKRTLSRFVPTWKKIKLAFITTLIGTSAAWCGNFVYSVLDETGIEGVQGAGAAVAWITYDQKINWQRDGIPAGAILQLNHKGQKNCGKSGNNHVTFANGWCAPGDLVEMKKNDKGEWVSTGVIRKGATIDGLGGNQGNQVKISTYSAEEICGVRYPDEDRDGKPIPLPPPVTKSINCTSGVKLPESTL